MSTSADAKRDFPTDRQPKITSVTPWLMFALVTGLIAYGWEIRDQDLFSPDDGTGYDLGIIGGCSMLLLLLYSARKRWSRLRDLGKIGHWLNIHMTLGLLGPTAILYHCNFHLGAKNSNVALFSMLIVMASGIIGRFIYLKINDVLLGEVLTMQGLTQEEGRFREQFEQAAFVDEHLKSLMARFRDEELAAVNGYWRRGWRLITLGHRIRRYKSQVFREIDHALSEASRTRSWTAATLNQRRQEYRHLASSYFFSIRRISELLTYSRLFALWHFAHIPLFMMLVMTATVHVVTVTWMF